MKNEPNKNVMQGASEEATPTVAKDARRIQRFAVLGGYAVALAIAGFAGYALRGPSAPAIPLGSNDLPAVDTAEPAPSSPTDNIPQGDLPPLSTGHPVDDSVQTLEVTWAVPYRTNEPLVPVTVDYSASYGADRSTWPKLSFSMLGHVPGTNLNLPVKTVILVEVPCDGMCFRNTFYYMMREEEKTFLLSRYSDTDISFLHGDFTVLENAVIPDLEFPPTLTGPKGQQLRFVEWTRRPLNAQFLRFVFHVDGLGDVFTDSPTAAPGFGMNGYYVPAPDGTYATYTIAIPFLLGDSRTPAITWQDGSKNTYDYMPAEYGGCGTTNLASVLDVTKADLTVAGKASNGDAIYFLKGSESEILKNLHASTHLEGTSWEEKQPYDEFVAAKPLFVWFDGFGRAIKFQRTAYGPMAECGKPVIYLYPEKTIDVSVLVAPKGGMTVSEPPHDEGWNVTATPESVITNHADGKTYPYLFWEGRGGLYARPSAGTVVRREEVQAHLTSTLAAYGLNSTEISDFMEYWLPKMQEKPYYFVTFLTTRAMNEIAPLTVTPRPDTVFRILMDYEPLDAPKTVPSLPQPRPFAREGFTVVEWGGVLGR